MTSVSCQTSKSRVSNLVKLSSGGATRLKWDPLVKANVYPALNGLVVEVFFFLKINDFNETNRARSAS